jgi:hypothetical protein
MAQGMGSDIGQFRLFAKPIQDTNDADEMPIAPIGGKEEPRICLRLNALNGSPRSPPQI